MARPLTAAERADLADVLRRLRDHFHEWPGYDGREHDLIGFAYYEGCGDSGCCGDLLAGAAPVALGAELVTRHGFQWVALGDGARPRYGVTHPALAGPVDLDSLEGGERCEYPDDVPGMSRGEPTYSSLAVIVRAAGE